MKILIELTLSYIIDIYPKRLFNDIILVLILLKEAVFVYFTWEEQVSSYTFSDKDIWSIQYSPTCTKETFAGLSLSIEIRHLEENFKGL